jgi:hypothetical protein
MLKYLQLTPAFQRWREAVPASQRDDEQAYAAYVARVDHWLCLLDVLWPKFIEVDGLVLRASDRLQNQREQNRLLHPMRALEWSDSDIEYVINHVHVPDLFLSDPDRDQIDDRVYLYLANVIAEVWRCRLEALFPDVQFEVGLSGDEHDPEVYVCVVRNEGGSE